MKGAYAMYVIQTPHRRNQNSRSSSTFLTKAASLCDYHTTKKSLTCAVFLVKPI